MDENLLRDLLNQVRDGRTDIDQALDTLQKLPFVDLGFAKLDSHRALRNSFPEVVYCEGKRMKHVIAILQRMTQGPGPVLARRASPEVNAAVQEVISGVRYEELARVIVYEPQPLPRRKSTMSSLPRHKASPVLISAVF